MENLHQQINDKLDYFYINNQIPHIIFHGSSGSGKKTIVYRFLEKIYDNNRNKMKHNIMFVNCSHGKGIKFIREELKFFAKTNLQMNQGVRFKSIVLFNADSLTTDAQSALRRCIELFSYNTRFFIIVENKHKLLNPILSRFCDIYVPEYINSNGCIENLHTYHLKTKFNTDSLQLEKKLFIKEKIQKIIDAVQFSGLSGNIHPLLSNISLDIYEQGYSAIDLIDTICSWNSGLGNGDISERLLAEEQSSASRWTIEEKIQFKMKFHSIKSEFRCEKLLILYMLNYIFFYNCEEQFKHHPHDA